MRKLLDTIKWPGKHHMATPKPRSGGSAKTRRSPRLYTQTVAGVVLVLVVLATSLRFVQAMSRVAAMPSSCEEFAYSTEEDFVTHGPMPPDGNPIISDGDLLGPNGVICARNADLVGIFDVNTDMNLGLDAADVVDAARPLVAFSTELDSPNTGQFTAGDLLIVDGTSWSVIPNIALTDKFSLGYDIGLDGVHFVGAKADIIAFLGQAAGMSRNDWLQNPEELAKMLEAHTVDIWFSTEGTPPTVVSPAFLDGDLLSAYNGTIIAPNSALLPASVPAGIIDRGVDFGLDGVASKRIPEVGNIYFSTEILYEGNVSFTDGDVLAYGTGVVAYTNWDLIVSFEPRTKELGLDALHLAPPPEPPLEPWLFLPWALEQWTGL